MNLTIIKNKYCIRNIYSNSKKHNFPFAHLLAEPIEKCVLSIENRYSLTSSARLFFIVFINFSLIEEQ